MDQTDAPLSPDLKPKKTSPLVRVPWGPWTAVVYAVAVYFVAQFAAQLLVIIYPHLRGWNRAHGEDWLSTVTAQFWYVLFAEALTVAAVWWFLHLRKSGLRTIGWRRLRLGDVGMAIGGYLVYFFLYAVLLGIATQVFPSLNVNQKQQLGFDNPTGTINLILTFFSLVVLPPLAEETVFRGFVFTGMRTKFRPLGAAIGTSLLFAVAHLEFGSGQPLLWTAALDTFILSLVLCYLRQKTDSLWPGILVHAGKNSLAFWVLYIVPLVRFHFM